MTVIIKGKAAAGRDHSPIRISNENNIHINIPQQKAVKRRKEKPKEKLSTEEINNILENQENKYKVIDNPTFGSGGSINLPSYHPILNRSEDQYYTLGEMPHRRYPTFTSRETEPIVVDGFYEPNIGTNSGIIEPELEPEPEEPVDPVRESKKKSKEEFNKDLQREIRNYRLSHPAEEALTPIIRHQEPIVQFERPETPEPDLTEQEREFLEKTRKRNIISPKKLEYKGPSRGFSLDDFDEEEEEEKEEEKKDEGKKIGGGVGKRGPDKKPRKPRGSRFLHPSEPEEVNFENSHLPEEPFREEEAVPEPTRRSVRIRVKKGLRGDSNEL